MYYLVAWISSVHYLLATMHYLMASMYYLVAWIYYFVSFFSHPGSTHLSAKARDESRHRETFMFSAAYRSTRGWERYRWNTTYMTSDDIPLNYIVLGRKMMTAQKTAHSSPIADPCKKRVCRQTQGDINPLFLLDRVKERKRGVRIKGSARLLTCRSFWGLCFSGRPRSAYLVYLCGFIICVLFSITNKLRDNLK